MKARGLGRGLGSLISSSDQKPVQITPPPAPVSKPRKKGSNQVNQKSVQPGQNSGVLEISIRDIQANPEQPRKVFDETKLKELADSIKEHGILQPLTVLEKQGKYLLIAGERRLRAATEAGLAKVPVIIKKGLDKAKIAEIALIENVQREDLNPVEEALGYQELLDNFNYTQAQLAKKLGKARASIANSLRTLQLPEVIKAALAEGKITMGHAKAILAEKTEAARMVLYKKIMAGGLSVRETEKLGKKNSGKAQTKRPAQWLGLAKDVRGELENQLGRRVSVSFSPNGDGKLTLEFSSPHDLEELVKEMK